MSPTEILAVLEHYKYILIYPTAIVEGPIVTVISGFLIHLGFLSFILTYITLLLSDFSGCTLYYLIGKYWRKWIWIKKYALRFGYDEKTEHFLENHFKKHKRKTFMLAKISHGLGWMAHVSAGVAGVSYLEFILFNVLTAIPKTLFLMLVGYYVGSSYEKINGYFGFISLTGTLIIILVVALFLINRYVKKFWKSG